MRDLVIKRIMDTYDDYTYNGINGRLDVGTKERRKLWESGALSLRSFLEGMTDEELLSVFDNQCCDIYR